MIGLAFSSYFLSFLISQAPIGFLADRIGVWKVLIVSPALSAVVSLAPFVNPSFKSTIICMSLLGVTLGSTFVQSPAAASELVPEESRSFYMGILDFIVDLSFIISPSVMGWVLQRSERTPFLLWSLLSLSSSAIFVLSHLVVLGGDILRRKSPSWN